MPPDGPRTPRPRSPRRWRSSLSRPPWRSATWPSAPRCRATAARNDSTSTSFARTRKCCLYAELENFASEATAKGYHTAHCGAATRFSTSRAIVWPSRPSPLRKNIAKTVVATSSSVITFACRKALRPGKYRLQLAIEDLTCRKIGQASLEFEVKDGKERQMTTNKHR